MRWIKVLGFVAFIAFLVSSCARGISTYEAANGKAKCGKYLR
jgi:hypothetical protein